MMDIDTREGCASLVALVDELLSGRLDEGHLEAALAPLAGGECGADAVAGLIDAGRAAPESDEPERARARALVAARAADILLARAALADPRAGLPPARTLPLRDRGAAEPAMAELDAAQALYVALSLAADVARCERTRADLLDRLGDRAGAFAALGRARAGYEARGLRAETADCLLAAAQYHLDDTQHDAAGGALAAAERLLADPATRGPRADEARALAARLRAEMAGPARDNTPAPRPGAASAGD